MKVERDIKERKKKERKKERKEIIEWKRGNERMRK
jgi:hypothetical protein